MLPDSVYESRVTKLVMQLILYQSDCYLPLVRISFNFLRKQLPYREVSPVLPAVECEG